MFGFRAARGGGIRHALNATSPGLSDALVNGVRRGDSSASSAMPTTARCFCSSIPPRQNLSVEAASSSSSRRATQEARRPKTGLWQSSPANMTIEGGSLAGLISTDSAQQASVSLSKVKAIVKESSNAPKEEQNVLLLRMALFLLHKVGSKSLTVHNDRPNEPNDALVSLALEQKEHGVMRSGKMRATRDRTVEAVVADLILKELIWSSNEVISDECSHLLHRTSRLAGVYQMRYVQNLIHKILHPYLSRFVGVADSAEELTVARKVIPVDIARAFTAASPAETPSDREQIWQRKALFILLAQVVRDCKGLHDCERPDLLLLETAIYLRDPTVRGEHVVGTERKRGSTYYNPNRLASNDYRHDLSHDQRCALFARLTDLHAEMRDVNLPTSMRWSTVVIRALKRSAVWSNGAHDLQELINTDRRSIQFAYALLEEHKEGLRQPRTESRELVHAMLNLEWEYGNRLKQAGSAFEGKLHGDEDLNRKRLARISRLSSMLAEQEQRFDALIARMSGKHHSVISQAQASCSTISMQLQSDDFDGAIANLRDFIDRLRSSSLSSGTHAEPDSLLRQHRLRMHARTAMIRCLSALASHPHVRHPSMRQKMLALMQIFAMSIDTGAWDVAQGVSDRYSKTVHTAKQGTAFEYARSWSRALGAMSLEDHITPLYIRGSTSRVARGDEEHHWDDFYGLLRIMTDSYATLDQRTVANPDKMRQRWRHAWKMVFIDDMKRSARLILSVAGCFTRKHQEPEGEADAATQALIVSFHERLHFLLNEVFGRNELPPRAWNAAEIALQQKLVFIPTKQGRVDALMILQSVRERYTKTEQVAEQTNQEQELGVSAEVVYPSE